MAWQIGDTVGGYRIEAVVGSGGMATVYRARHERLAREVAIKVMHPAFVSDAGFMVRFEREAQIVAQLDHPNIVPVYDFNEHDGQPYLVMKHINGQTLSAYLRTESPPLPLIVQITEAVAAALSYAHTKGVLHRDVKPSNVLLDQNNTPYLTDFGLARLAHAGESSLSAGMVIGTPNYLSPEQASGEREVTARADVYSLGVLLYEMVVGTVPFESDTPYATVHKHIYEPPPLPSELNPEVPTAVELVLLKALDKDPDRRCATPNDLATAFKEAVAESGLAALSPDRSRGISRAALRQPAPPPERGHVSAPAPKAKNDAVYDALPPMLLEGEDDWAGRSESEIVRLRLESRREQRHGFLGHAIPYAAVNLMIVTGSGFEPGALIPALAWGSGLAAHAINTFYPSSRRVEQLYLDFDDAMSADYGADWRDTAPPDLIAKRWQQARDLFETRKGFYSHASVFVLINLMIWLIWVGAMVNGEGFVPPFPLLVTGGWGIGLRSHYLKMCQGDLNAHEEADFAAELAAMGGSGSRERLKRKNDMNDFSGGGIRLTEDGELTESMVAEFQPQDEQRRARR